VVRSIRRALQNPPPQLRIPRVNTRAIIEQIRALTKEEQAEVFEMVHRLEDDAIPESFWQGLDDIRRGRVVDMETALRDRPPK
jgi:hypothetical protein